MEFLGEYLKKERERRNLSLEEVEKSTKIKGRFISAIEEERFESVPSLFYIKSFLRLYAEFLGLNPNDILNRFRQEQNDLSVKPPAIPAFLIPQKRRVAPSTLLLLIFGIVLASSMVYFVSRVSPKRISSSTVLRPAATSPAVQVSTAQEREENVSLFETDEEKSSKPKEDEELTNSLSFAVLEAGFGKEVEIVQNRPTLTGVSSEFGCNHKRVYFLTRIRSPANRIISHVWFWEEKEVQTIDMEVKSPAWSIYSYVTIRAQHIGQWRVEVRDGSKVLSSQFFKVMESDCLPERKRLGQTEANSRCPGPDYELLSYIWERMAWVRERIIYISQLWMSDYRTNQDAYGSI